MNTIVMTWPKIVLVALYALSALITILRIGKERKPITPGDAVFTVVLSVPLILLVMFA